MYGDDRGAGTVWVEIFASGDARAVAEMALVLEALSIPNVVAKVGAESRLAVRQHDVSVAQDELRDYLTERETPQGGARAIELLGHGWPGVFCYIAVLLAVAIADHQSILGYDWSGAGRAAAGAIANGEWWRTVTALTLHADIVHLAGNVIFGSFFGYWVARYVGTGLGWGAILASGAVGNWVNALLHSPDHRSIGASTAVFGALGILSAYTWRKGYLRNTPWRARFAPITAGIALLAFTGTGGENTDLGAHLFGFSVGIATGLLLARDGTCSWAALQRGSGPATLLALSTAWMLALSASAAARTFGGP